MKLKVRLAVVVLVTVLTGALGVLAGARPASASNGRSSTGLIVEPDGPTAYGQIRRFTAVVNDKSVSCDFPILDCDSPTGSVTFVLDARDTIQSGQVIGNVDLSNRNPNGGERAELEYADIEPGEHSVTAFYRPGNFDASAGVSQPFVVNKAAPSATLSQSSASSDPGDKVTLTATVAGPNPDAIRPNGRVKLYDNGEPLPDILIFGGGDPGSIEVDSLGPGAHTITGEYQGDRLYHSATTGPIVHRVRSGIIPKVTDLVAVVMDILERTPPDVTPSNPPPPTKEPPPGVPPIPPEQPQQPQNPGLVNPAPDPRPASMPDGLVPQGGTDGTGDATDGGGSTPVTQVGGSQPASPREVAGRPRSSSGLALTGASITMLNAFGLLVAVFGWWLVVFARRGIFSP